MARKEIAFSRRAQRPDPAVQKALAERPYWWAYDSATKCYTHRGTGELLRLIGPATPPDRSSSIWQWFRFDYEFEPEAVRYPLLVQLRRGSPEPHVGISQWIDWVTAEPLEYEDRAAHGKDAFWMWRVDHDRSLALWRSEEGRSEDALPPYGLWRRADLAVISCGLCVPLASPLGHPAEMVLLNGGWLNGAWRQDFYRRSTYSWNRASGADKSLVDRDGRMRPGVGLRTFFPLEEAGLLPLNAQCPAWERGEMRVMWKDPRMDDAVQTVACMRERRTGETLYVTSWMSEDPLTEKTSWYVDMHYAGYGIIARDVADFRLRPAEQLLTDPINISHDFSAGDFIQVNAVPARARYFEIYDPDLARTLVPDLRISRNMLHPNATSDPSELCDWREVRNAPFGSYRLSLALHEAMMHALPFSTGFDLGASTRQRTLGEHATFDFRSGETGCSWLYESTLRLSPTLASDGDGPGWRLLFD